MMQMREEQEHQQDEPSFFKTLSSSSDQSRHNSFSMNIGQDQPSLQSSAVSLFKNDGGKESQSDSDFLAGASFRGRSMKKLNPDQFLQEPSPTEMTMTQNSLESSLAQHEKATLEMQNQDKMNMLHSRLHQEADKIRRWKIQTEIEIRQKERGLNDAQQTIESQRKSLLDLQLQNENLSMRLQEEIENRIEISQKIVSTRDMCNLVKDYAAKLQGKLVEGEHVTEELQAGREKQLEEIKLLELQFEELSLAHSNKLNEFKTELQHEKSKSSEAERTMSAKLAGIEQECGDLQRSCEEKDRALSELREDVKKASRQLALLRQEKEYLQESLNQANEEVEANQQLLAKIKGELKETTAARNQLQTEQAEMQEKYKELVVDTETAKQQIEEDKNTVQKLEEQVQAKESSLTELEQKLTELREDKKQLEENIEEQNKIMQKKEADIGSLKEELKEVLEREKVSYDKLDSMRKELQSESSENAKLLEVIEFTRKEKHGVEEELQKSKEAAQSLDEKIKLLEQDMVVERTKLETVRAAKENLETTKDELEKEHRKQIADQEQLLEKEKGENKSLTDQLDKIETERSSLEEKNRSLQGQGGSKTKQIKDLSQEIKTLKGKVTTLTKQKDSYQTDMKSLEKELEVAKSDMESLEKEAVELRAQKEEAERKSKAVITAEEQQMKNMEEVMLTYKAEYDKIIENKDHALAKLKKTLLDETAAKNEKEGCCKALEDELSLERKKLMEAEAASQALATELQGQIKTLEAQIQERDEQIAKQREEAERLSLKMDEQIAKQQAEAERLALEMKKKKKEEEEKAAKAKKRRSSPKSKPNSSPEPTKPADPSKPTINPTKAAVMSQPAERMVPATPTNRPTLAEKMSTPLRTPLSGRLLPQEASSKNLRTPLTVKAVTPRTTPQRSILKQSSSAKLKRRVAFAEENQMDQDDDGMSSDSSTSQLMEFQVDEIDQRFKQISTDRRVPSHEVTPMRVQPSPHITPNQKKGPVGRVQRSLTKANVKLNESSLQKEQQQFTELYPELEEEGGNEPDKKKKQSSQSTKNARKTPKRAYKIKGWGDSPRGRKKKKDAPKESTKENDLEWFDNDAVYGFFD